MSLTLYPQRETDSLISIIKNHRDPIVKVDALNALSFSLRVSSPDSSLLYGRQAEGLAMQHDYPLGLADAKMRQAIAHTNMGNFYPSLQLYLEAKTIYESLNDRGKIASCLNNIGRLYGAIDDIERSLEHYEESAIMYAELKDYDREGTSLNNIGYIYKMQGKHEAALDYLRRAQDRAQELYDYEKEVYPIYNIGSVFVQLGILDSAFIYLNESLARARKYRNQYITALSLIDLGKAYLQQQNFDRAESSFEEAFRIANEAGMRSERRDAAEQLSIAYERQSKLEGALRYYKMFKTENDSLFNRDLAQQMAFQEAEYEFNQRRIKDEVERRKAELENERVLANAIWIRNTLIVGLIVMILITYLIYLNFIRKRKANEALRKLNEQIESQAEELRRANHEIIVMNNNLETVVSRRTEELKRRNQQLKEYLSSNSHIIRAPLARILGLVDLYEPGDTKNLDFINENIHKSATELDQALRDINEKLSDVN
ncbi:MAG: tetratricopeptide repeat protein [Ekhidna sp.]